MWNNSDEKYKEWKTWQKRRSTASKGKKQSEGRLFRLKRTFRMNGLTEELAGLFKILKEKGKRQAFSEEKTGYAFYL